LENKDARARYGVLKGHGRGAAPARASPTSTASGRRLSYPSRDADFAEGAREPEGPSLLPQNGTEVPDHPRSAPRETEVYNREMLGQPNSQ